CELIARGESETGPFRRALADVLVPPVVEVDVVAELIGSIHQHAGVIQLAQAIVRLGLFRADVVIIAPRHLLPGVRAGDPDRLTAVVVVDVVPTLDHLNAAGELTDRNRTPNAEVVVRNGP